MSSKMITAFFRSGWVNRERTAVAISCTSSSLPIWWPDAGNVPQNVIVVCVCRETASRFDHIVREPRTVDAHEDASEFVVHDEEGGSVLQHAAGQTSRSGRLPARSASTKRDAIHSRVVPILAVEKADCVGRQPKGRSAPMTHLGGTSELRTQMHNA
jgi:hypothetical protein